ncbi:extensin family protein [Novosphingobium sp. SL115]|uniref:extensin family protein n=1 Tax=Novosphingobium sp. SL115 TaxID=2995150 RepID=UPI002276870D|nr:extensin family protein [Novosphingobium sp. SL115]MCY1669748.1 extensin family protein [Novosphingobium sp. SL115]
MKQRGSFSLMTIPAVLALLLTGCSSGPDLPQRKPSHGTGASITQSPQGRACLAGLGATKASFTPLADQYYGAGCSALGAVKLVSLMGDDGRLEVTNLGPVSCPAASALQGWARFGVDRAARQILGSPLVRVETMGSYSCRTVAGSNRLSAHAAANAVDVAAFRLADGRRISVLNDWNSSSPQVRAFLRTVRDSACKRFGTVLSPDYNAAHRNHFHLEPGGLKPFCR